VNARQGDLWAGGPGSQAEPAFSLDGKWVVYDSESAIYVRRFPDTGEQWQIAAGGFQPMWSRDGRSVFYIRTADAMVMMVPLKIGEAIEGGPPQALFKVNLTALQDPDQSEPVIAISPDARRFLVATKSESYREPEFNVVTNWQQLLQNR